MFTIEAVAPSTSAGDIILTLTGDTNGPPAQDIVRATAVAADSVDIDINSTAAENDDITLLNVPSVNGGFKQTIPARITNNGADGTIQLIVFPVGAATLSQSTVTLVRGAMANIIITPTAVSSAVNDVTILAMKAHVLVGEEDMTVVQVRVPDHVRRANTPAAMADRILPRVDTAHIVEVTPNLGASGQKVTLTVFNQNANNGTVTVNGNNTLDMTNTGPVNLRGGTQTAPGSAGGLQLGVRVRGEDTTRSGGFSVAAIPENWAIALVGLVMGADRGIRVTNSWCSDSGNLADLDMVERSEVVEYLPGTGVFAGVPVKNSGYIRADIGRVDDTHGTPVTLLSGSGRLVARQAFIFRDQRTGATDIPANNSGFEITREAVLDPATNIVTFTTSKVGKAVTAKGVTTTAGAGSVSENQKIP
jgi:hypothetical protein